MPTDEERSSFDYILYHCFDGFYVMVFFLKFDDCGGWIIGCCTIRTGRGCRIDVDKLLIDEFRLCPSDCDLWNEFEGDPYYCC